MSLNTSGYGVYHPVQLCEQDLPFTDLQFHSLLQCIEGEGKQGRPIVILVCIGIQYGESILIVAAMQLFCIHNKLLAVSCVCMWMCIHVCVVYVHVGISNLSSINTCTVLSP